jgi:hypothetical protein
MGFLDKLKGGLSGPSHEGDADRRGTKRIQLPIPVRLKVGGGPVEPRRIRDISLHGLAIVGYLKCDAGDPAAVQFLGYPKICEPFTLLGHVVRFVENDPRGVAIRIDRKNTPKQALDQFRKLVLHYLRHRPLLDELDTGYFEGRCLACGWIGRVGASKPRCSKCGGRKILPVGRASG